jgi:hypothetical protein
MNIIYPLKKSKWEKEILFSLRSLDKYFVIPCNVHICGDYLPNWATNIEYHEFSFSQDKNTDANVAPILEWACSQFDDFIWMSDDIYFLKRTKVGHLVPHPVIGNLNKVKNRGKRPWQKRLWKSFDMLKNYGLDTIYNHVTHTPSLYNSKQMIECAKRFPVFEGEVLHEIIYYNLFGSKNPPILTEKAGFYKKGLTVNLNDHKYRFLNHDDNGLSGVLGRAIARRFNEKSIYEL